MRIASRTVLTIGLAVVAGVLRGDEPSAMSGPQFDKLHALIKRQPHESRWIQIDWYPSVQEGRERAAAEGKPLFIWAGSGGAPAAGC
jgi:hypothetical protein